MVHVPVILSVSVTTPDGERFAVDEAFSFSLEEEERGGADELFVISSDKVCPSEDEAFCRRDDILLVLLEPGECDVE